MLLNNKEKEMEMARAKKGSALVTPKQAVASFTASSLLKILNAGHLGGAIEELVLTVEDGVGTVSAVDKTSCVFAFAQGDVGEIKNAVIGLKEVGFFIKAIGAAGSEKIEFLVEDDRWFKLQMVNAGEIKILLTAPDMIPTAISNYNEPIDKMKASVTHAMGLNKEAVDKFLYFQELVKNTTTTISVKNGLLSIGSGKYETRTFQVPMGPIAGPDMTVVVFGEFLKAVLSVLDWSEGACGKPTIFLGKDAPVLIEQDPDYFWSLSPSAEGGE